jgi:hypothetical protein
MAVSPSRADPLLIESSFEILPGEIRQVRLHFDEGRQFKGDIIFNGWITSDTGFAVVDACVGSAKVETREVPADADPHEAEWVTCMQRLPPGEDLVLFVKNTGDRAARYRGRIR